MNKKIIKYLIGIILIAATLILVPTKQTMAATVTVEKSTFNTSKNLFCLNKGYPYGDQVTFTVIDENNKKYEDYFDGGQFKFPLNNTRSADIDVLKYIISESDSGSYGNRRSISSYTPQKAIWKLASGPDIVSSTAADKLVAEALAYNVYINKGDNVKEPEIVDDGNGSTFSIYYTKITKKYNGEEGIFSNLISTSVNGANITTSGAPSDREGHTHKDVYTINSGADSVSVEIEYEKSRTATLELYESHERVEGITYIGGTDEEDSEFIRIGDSYYCVKCDILSECTKIDKEDQLSGWDTYYGVDPAVLEASYMSGRTVVICNGHYDQFDNPYYKGTIIVYDPIENLYYKAYEDVTHVTTGHIYIRLRNYTNKNDENKYKPQNLLHGTGAVVTDTKKETFNLIQPVTISFNKKDFSNNNVSGATLNIKGGTNVASITGTNLDKNGNITIGSGSITVTPSNGKTGTFTLNLSETAPTEYKAIPDTTLTVNYNNGAVTSITSNNGTYVTSSGSTVTIKNRPAVKISFDKKDFSGNLLTGAKISVVGSTGVSKIEGLTNGELTTNSSGSFGTITVYPTHASYDAGSTGEFKLTVTETKVPTGYQGMPESVTLTVKYNTNTGAVTSITEGSEHITSSGSTVTIKNKPKANLIINKTDSLHKDSKGNPLKLADARFKIELTNVESIEGYQIAHTEAGEEQNDPTVVYVKTDSNGQITLTGMVPTGGKGTITAKITEVGVPYTYDNQHPDGYYYKVLENPITVTMTYNNGAWTGTGVSGNTLTVGIQNTPYINLSGMVWQDGQTGVKDVAGPNGLKDSGESGLQGIIVELYSVKDKKVIKNTITDANGNYSFTDVPKTNEGYKVTFKYNGITYVETPTGTVSKPSEVNRTAFNNRFKTISRGQSNDGTALGYTYNSSNKTSTLNSTIAGHTTGTTDAKFQMSAQTGTYTNTVTDINCGLVKKNFDLTIGTDVKNATLKINEKETTYTYAEIMDGKLNADFQNSSSTVQDVTYNLYLYSSDYNYRIADYKTDIVGNNVPDSDNNNIADYENLKNLEAYVTYSVILKAQTTQNATVDEFVYYYDAAYTPHNIVSTDKYNVSIDTNARKITFTSKNNGFKLTSPDYRVEVELTFKINKDVNGNLIVKENATNIAEITKYSTDEGGLIDKDSAPANGITNGKITQYEDDTDEAKGLNIVLRTGETRTITGTVFDDTDKDGKLNNENAAVNDVIVQLIEIKKIGGQYYEYIWQETRSGNNQVKTTARNGYTGTTYTNSITAGSGKYEFKDFIPGNYIIRFIYGDGSTYDITDNVKKYNGQDYKSTKDSKYQAQWYNTAGYTAGESVARDNEARRLEVMTYSTTINETNGADLANKTAEALENTWMCAETSRINIPVDADNTTTDANNTTASYNYTNTNKKVLFGNMNFGLALRPQTNLVLEKHITALKITPSGTGVQSIVDAKAKSIENIVNGTTVETEGVTQGLATIKSKRDNRGFWEVATDVEELMQGAELEVEYTYVLRNDGDADYLSKTLVEAYENQDVKPYNEVLTEIKDTVKGTMKNGTYSYSNNNTIGTYLGKYYYTGSKGTNDELVSSRVEVFEEALNNDLVFDELEGTSFKVAREASKENVYGVNKTEGTKEIEIDTVVQNKSVSQFLTPKLEENYTTQTADWSKTITLRTTLATVSGGKLGANLPSYIAEIVQYSNAAGRKDMTATPGNLSYVHSDDTSMTMASDNEQDEFWGETIIITKPTGEDKLTGVQIAIITISAVAVLGVGIVLIKKFVLKK